MKKKMTDEPLEVMSTGEAMPELPKAQEEGKEDAPVNEGGQHDAAQMAGDEGEAGQVPASAEALPPPKAAPEALPRQAQTREVMPPKAYIRPRTEPDKLSYGRRAALYQNDREEYRSMIGGNKQWT